MSENRIERLRAYSAARWLLARRARHFGSHAVELLASDMELDAKCASRDQALILDWRDLWQCGSTCTPLQALDVTVKFVERQMRWSQEPNAARFLEELKDAVREGGKHGDLWALWVHALERTKPSEDLVSLDNALQ